jgi:Protein of unknown function (DUF669)
MAKASSADTTTQTDSLDEFLAGVSEDGTHRCVVDSVSTSTSKTSGRDWIVFKYTVTDPSSDVDGEDFQEFFENFGHVTLGDYNEMSSHDKRKVREAKRRLRERLMTLGVAEGETSGFKDYDSLMGRDVNVTVETSIGNGGRKFINIRNVELYDEEL